MESSRSSGPSSMLAPGLRFHPTDEELVRYYLKRKVCGKALRFDAISEIDIYKSEPWDLPSMSKLNSRDLEWYFFSVLGKKYGNGAKTNRATEMGYWKTTGKDRAVYGGKQIVGMKKTLVYHSGKAPKGQRTNWVMHEYRLVNLELEMTQDAFVLCRVYQKSGSGPKNGERYGAPFVEEEWEDDELEFVPKVEAAEEIDFGEDSYLDSHDIEQILASDAPSDIVPLPCNFNVSNGSWVEGTAESVNDTQMVPAGKKYYEPEQYLDTSISELSALYDTCIEPRKHEYIGESSKLGNTEDLDFLLNEQFLDAFGDLQNDGGFIEANNPIGNDSDTFDMLEEYLPFFDANGEYSENFVYDPSVEMGVVNAVSYQASLTQNVMEPNEGTERATLPSGQFIDNSDKVALLSADKRETTNLFQSDYQLPFIKQASQMLRNVPAPPAFAAEFPSKDTILRLNSMALSPSSAHDAAGTIHIRNLDEQKNFNIVLSFGFARDADGSASLGSSVSICPGKTLSAIFRSGFYFIFLWVSFSMSNKIGTYFCAGGIS